MLLDLFPHLKNGDHGTDLQVMARLRGHMCKAWHIAGAESVLGDRTDHSSVLKAHGAFRGLRTPVSCMGTSWGSEL